MRGGLFWLNDKQWARIEPHLPTGLTGPDRDDDRRIISGIVHMLQSGARWRDCPREYGPYTTIYNRFNRWAKHGRWCAIFEALARAYPADLYPYPACSKKFAHSWALKERAIRPIRR
jgi:transposase